MSYQNYDEFLSLPGGVISPTHKLYIERVADEQFRQELLKENIITVHGPHQSGKSSLLLRGLYEARRRGARTLFVDLQRFDDLCFVSSDAFMYSLADFVTQELQLSPTIVDEFWDKSKRRSPFIIFSRLLDYILSQIQEPIILAIDEADRLLGTDFGSSFFGYIRSFKADLFFNENRRKLFTIIVVTVHPFFLIDGPGSPFNEGSFIPLRDFDEIQVLEINQQYGSPIDASHVPKLTALFGGHPYLTRLAFYIIVTKQLSWDDFTYVVTNFQEPFWSHLQSIVHFLSSKPDLQIAFKEIIERGYCTNQLALFKLQWAGLIKQNSSGECNYRCYLYRDFFRSTLRSNLGGKAQGSEHLAIREQDIKSLIVNHRRHLQKLKEQQASLGLHTPAHILTEIEDTEKEIHGLEVELRAILFK